MEEKNISSLLTALKLDENPLISQFMFIEELNNADGSFVISSIIKDQIEKNHNVILILCHNSLGHFHSISQKLGYNLMSLKESEDVFVIEILEKIINENFLNVVKSLKKLYFDLKKQISEWSNKKGVCVILENISNLLLVDMKEVFTFITYVRAVVLEQKNSSVVCSFHNFENSLSINNIAKAIKHFSDLTVILKDLQTGRASDITGHLTVKRRGKNNFTTTSEYQYQLQDKSFVVFAPGSRNFL